MADYSDLDAAVGAAYVAAGYVVAPSGDDPERIPAHGAGSWLAIRLGLQVNNTMAGGTARESHNLRVAGIVSRTVNVNVGMRTAQDLALAIRRVLDTSTVLSSVYAHAVPEGYDITVSGGRLIVSVEFIVTATTAIV